MIAEKKLCCSCHQPMNGRTDKKFCNDYCRNTHHNQLNCDGNKQVRNINHQLRKNRRILETLLHPAKQIIKITRQKLLYKGFSFTYFTHTLTNKKGSSYFFCYEYGYLPVEEGGMIIIKRKDKKGQRNIEQGTEE